MDPERDDDYPDGPLTEDELASDLADVLYNAADELTRERTVEMVRDFGQDGIRYNSGFTLRLSDGTEYQLTIVRSA